MPKPDINKHLPAIAVGIVALAALAFGSLQSATPSGSYSLAHIERADTPSERERGLGGRTDIAPDYGMLFVFDTADTYSFWMKDMLAPIDIIWLADDGVIVGIEGNVATSTYPQAFTPPAPVRYVLETKAGTADAKGWEVGMVLSLPLP